MIVAVVLEGCTSVTGHGTQRLTLSNQRAAVGMATHESLTVAAIPACPDQDVPGGCMPEFQPGATWKGTLGPQNPNPMVPGTHFVSSATHPLVTVFARNFFASAETLRFDLVISDGPPPPGYAGTPIPSTSTTAPGPYPGWTEVVWDRHLAEPQVRNTVLIPSGDQANIVLDWPDTTNAGQAAPEGRYWGIVEVSGYWVSGPLVGGGSVATGNWNSATTSSPTTGRTDLWTPLAVR
jgi:hypothetical protein